MNTLGYLPLKRNKNTLYKYAQSPLPLLEAFTDKVIT